MSKKKEPESQTCFIDLHLIGGGGRIIVSYDDKYIDEVWKDLLEHLAMQEVWCIEHLAYIEAFYNGYGVTRIDLKKVVALTE
ncbi:MAG: hypothetical protein V3T30_05970 [Thermodesulfobacteriota bacterium]